MGDGTDRLNARYDVDHQHVLTFRCLKNVNNRPFQPAGLGDDIFPLFISHGKTGLFISLRTPDLMGETGFLGRREFIGNRVFPPSTFRFIINRCLHGVQADSQVFCGIGQGFVYVGLEPGQVYQHTSRPVLHISGVIGITANNRLVQCDLLEIDPAGNSDISCLGPYISDAVQIINHQTVACLAGGQVFAGDAFLMAVHGVVFMGGLMGIGKVLPDEIETPAAVEITTLALKDGFRGNRCASVEEPAVGNRRCREAGSCFTQCHFVVGYVQFIVKPPHHGGNKRPLGARATGPTYTMGDWIDAHRTDQVGFEEELLPLLHVRPNLVPHPCLFIECTENGVQDSIQTVDFCRDLFPGLRIPIVDVFLEQAGDTRVDLVCIHLRHGDK